MVDEATVDDDPEMFDCEACPVADALSGLDAVNTRAWDLYRRLVARLSADLHAGGIVLDRLTADLNADDFAELWRRLVILYDTICPPPDPPT